MIARNAVVLVLLSAVSLVSAPLMAAEPESVTLSNVHISVTWQPKARSFSVSAGARQFIRQGTFGDFLPEGSLVVRTEKGPEGDSLSVIHNKARRRAELVVLKDQPFVFVRFWFRVPEDEVAEIRSVTPFSAPLEIDTPPENLRVRAYDGLTPATEAKTTYLAISVADPTSRAGAVGGWLSHDRGSGIALVKPDAGKVRLEARCEYGLLRVPSGELTAGETFAVGWFDDVLDGLQRYASAMAGVYKIALKPVPSGYCTWYHAGALDEKRMATLAQWCGKNLKPYGFDVLQIDDGWQVSRRDFTEHNPKGKYPAGMKATADAIRQQGLQAGIWLTPFGWDFKRPVFAEHQDWFVKHPGGEIYSVKWGGDCLDMSNPHAREFLYGVVHRMTHDWGYQFFKLDGLWAGMCAGILYPNPQYRDDQFGDALFFDPTYTNVQAFRTGLRVVREATGPETYLLGCTVAQNMRTLGGSIGLVDGIRVGVDSGRKWEKMLPNVQTASSVYYLHGRVWHNDPDVVYVAPSFSLAEVQAWASWVALTGQMYLVSDWLPDMPAERIEVIRRTIPNHNRNTARPLDLYREAWPRVWHLRDGQGPDRRDVVGLFNWGNEAAEIAVSLAELGLPPGDYARFDFWANRALPAGPDVVRFKLPPHSAKIVALRKLADHPVVLSTSRHISQGILELSNERWNAPARILEGVSALVAGDRYELRIAGARASQADVSDDDRKAGVKIQALPLEAGLLRVQIESPVGRSVRWHVTFTP